MHFSVIAHIYHKAVVKIHIWGKILKIRLLVVENVCNQSHASFSPTGI